MIDCPSCGKIAKKYIKPGKYICSVCKTKFIVNEKQNTELVLNTSPIFLIIIAIICCIIFTLSYSYQDSIIKDFALIPKNGFSYSYTDGRAYMNDILNKVKTVGSEINISSYKKVIFYPPPKISILYRSITYNFIHSSFSHLLLNLIGLMFFGIYVQNKMGIRKFIFYFFLLSFFTGLVLTFFTSKPTIGISGIVFGLILSYAWFFPHQEISIRRAPIPSYIFMFIYSGIEILKYFFNSDNISQETHLIGLIVSLILMFIMFKKDRKIFKKRAT